MAVLVLASPDAAVTGLSGLQDRMAASLNNRQQSQHLGRIEEASEEQVARASLPGRSLVRRPGSHSGRMLPRREPGARVGGGPSGAAAAASSTVAREVARPGRRTRRGCRGRGIRGSEPAREKRGGGGARAVAPEAPQQRRGGRSLRHRVGGTSTSSTWSEAAAARGREWSGLGSGGGRRGGGGGRRGGREAEVG